MARFIAILSLGPLLALTAPVPCPAWGATTHRLIAWRAFRAVDGWPLPDARAALILLDGAVAPDRPGPGHLPVQAHIWHVAPDARGLHRGEGPSAARTILARILAGGLGDEATIFQMGRLCHVVADLHQPLHTGPRPVGRGMNGVHSGFEHAVDAWAMWLVAPLPTPPPPCADGIEGVLEDRAREAARWRDLAIAQTAAGRPLDGLVGPVSLALVRSVRLSAALFERALGVRGHRRPAQVLSLPWAWTTAACILICIGLGLAPVRPARWPGTRLPAARRREVVPWGRPAADARSTLPERSSVLLAGTRSS